MANLASVIQQFQSGAAAAASPSSEVSHRKTSSEIHNARDPQLTAIMEAANKMNSQNQQQQRIHHNNSNSLQPPQDISNHGVQGGFAEMSWKWPKMAENVRNLRKMT